MAATTSAGALARISQWETQAQAIRNFARLINTGAGTQNCNLCALATNRILAHGLPVEGITPVSTEVSDLITKPKYKNNSIVSSFVNHPKFVDLFRMQTEERHDLTGDRHIIEVTIDPLPGSAPKKVYFKASNYRDIEGALRDSAFHTRKGSFTATTEEAFLKPGGKYGFVILTHKDKGKGKDKGKLIGHILNVFVDADQNIFYIDSQQYNNPAGLVSRKLPEKGYIDEVFFVFCQPPEGFQIKPDPLETPILRSLDLEFERKVKMEMPDPALSDEDPQKHLSTYLVLDELRALSAEKIEELKKVAGENMFALVNIATCYREGIKCPKDELVAVTLFEKAVGLGNAHALIKMGICYENGKGVPLNLEKAFELYQEAYAKGDESAVKYVIDCYTHGKGVLKSPEAALKLARGAASAGNKTAINSLASMYLDGLLSEGRVLLEQDITQGIELFKKASKLGDADASNNLGCLYHHGKKIGCDLKEAIECFELAIRQGSLQAKNNLALVYRDRKGIENLKNAFRLFNEAAYAGNNWAKYNLSKMYLNGILSDGVVLLEKNTTKGLELLVEASKLGLAEASCVVGSFYYIGEHVITDLQQAIKYYELAIKQGSDPAKYNLAFAYRDGKGVDKDTKTAIRLFKEAADAGVVDSKDHLGRLFLEGVHSEDGSIILEKDITHGLKLLNEASKLGFAHASNNLGWLYYNGEKVDCNLKKSIEYLELAIKQGSDDAKNNLARAYGEGKGVLKDIKTAIRLLKEADSAGHIGAKYNLARLYLKGVPSEDNSVLLEKDITHGLKLLKEASKLGHEVASCDLGQFYYRGQNVHIDYRQAIEYYELAIKQGSVMAKNNLGLCYQDGLGVTRDIKTAIRWFKEASDAGARIAKRNLGCIYLRQDQRLNPLDSLVPLGSKSAEDIATFNEGIKLLKEASDLGDEISSRVLGEQYSVGYNMEINAELAILYYSKAIEQNKVSSARLKLAKIYHEGLGSDKRGKNLTLALKLYEELHEELFNSTEGVIRIGAFKTILQLLCGQEVMEPNFRQAFYYCSKFLNQKPLTRHDHNLVIPVIDDIIKQNESNINYEKCTVDVLRTRGEEQSSHIAYREARIRELSANNVQLKDLKESVRKNIVALRVHPSAASAPPAVGVRLPSSLAASPMFPGGSAYGNGYTPTFRSPGAPVPGHGYQGKSHPPAYGVPATAAPAAGVRLPSLPAPPMPPEVARAYSAHFAAGRPATSSRPPAAAGPAAAAVAPVVALPLVASVAVPVLPMAALLVPPAPAMAALPGGNPGGPKRKQPSTPHGDDNVPNEAIKKGKVSAP